MPQISVIVPVYKVESYLRRCVDSILNQTFTDFELILVDDGSPDNCGTICDEYAERDQRVIVIHKINNGVSSARNSGLNICTSDYVGFVDSDDYIGPDWFKRLLAPLLAENADLVSADYQYVSEDGNIIYVSNYSKETYTINSHEECIDFILNGILCNKIGWGVVMHVFKAKYIFNHHVRFCETCDNYGEDLGFVLEYSLYCKKAVGSAANGYFYVLRNDSMMHTANDLSRFNRMNELAKSFRAYMISEGGFQELLDIFPIIHYYLLNAQINEYKSKSGLSVKELRPLLLKNIKDFAFFSEQMKNLRSHKTLLSQYSDYQLGVQLSIAEYYADGHAGLFVMKRLLNKLKATGKSILQKSDNC